MVPPFANRPMFIWANHAGSNQKILSCLASTRSFCAIGVRVSCCSGCLCLGYCAVCDPVAFSCWAWLISAVKPRTWRVMSGPARSRGECLSFECKDRSSLGQKIMRLFHKLLIPICWYFLYELPSNQYELSQLRKAIRSYSWFAGRAAIRATPGLKHSSLRIAQDCRV